MRYPFILSMTPFRESRRSSRVPLRVAIAVEGDAAKLTCDGETVVVSLYGALISTAIGLTVGMRVSIHVYLTDKRAKGRVVYVDPKNPLRCGIELDKPQNIWGVPLPPEDWDESAASNVLH
jgi:PilZ domain